MRNILLILSTFVLGCVEPPAATSSLASALKAGPDDWSGLSEQVEANTEALDQIRKRVKQLEAAKNADPPAVEARPENPSAAPLVKTPAGSSTTPAKPPPAQLSEWYVVEWTQPGCPPCIRWERTEKPQLIASGIPVRTIDIRQQPTMARQWQIVSTPTIQLCSRSDRKVRQRWNGYTTAETIKQRTRRKSVQRTVQPASYSNGRYWSVGTARNPWSPTKAELISHLQRSHGYSYGSLAGMSTGQLNSLHSQSHGG